MAYSDYSKKDNETFFETKYRLFKMHDRIVYLKNMKNIIGIPEDEDLELRNLEVDFDNQYNEFKSGE